MEHNAHPDTGGGAELATPTSAVSFSSAANPVVVPLPLPERWLDPDAAKVLRRLRHCGYKAYLVGGCVRDLLVGRYPKDFDVATSALPREVKRVFSNCRLIGRRFRLAHVIFHQNIIEVATFRRDPLADPLNPEGEEPIEDAEGWLTESGRRDRRPRASVNQGGGVDSEPGDGDEGRELSRDESGDEELSADAEEIARDEAEDLLIRSDNVFGTPMEDALRRDFTINGLFYDVATQELIDWTGGLHDVDLRIVRTIGSPEVRFREDPVRMMRAIKFAASLHFTIEPLTWTALCQVSSDIHRAAAPRVLEEVLRMLKGGAAASCFRLLELSGLLKQILPELAPLIALELASESVGAASEGSPLRLRMGSSEVVSGIAADPDGHVVDASEGDADRSTASAPEVLGLFAYLRALDRINQVRTPLPNHLLLATLCLVPVFRLLKTDQGPTISDQVFRKAGFILEELGTRLRVSRRDRERARLVLMGLTRLLWKPERGAPLVALSKKSYFPEALLLYGIHCLASRQPALEFDRLYQRVQEPGEFSMLLEQLQHRLGSGDRTAAPRSARGPESHPDEEAGERSRRKRRRPRRRSHGGSSDATGGMPPESSPNHS